MSATTGQDVILYSETAGDNLTWDASAASLTITGGDGALAFDVPDGFARFDEAIQANGGVTGDLTGTVLTAAQTNITSLGTLTGLSVSGNITVTGNVDGRDVSADGTKLDGIESGATADQTASEILTAIKTVDGPGTGLDADTVDGLQASQFLRSDTSDSTSGALTVSGNVSCGGVLRSTLSTGDEGGEIFLASPANGGDSAVIDNYYLSSPAISMLRMGSACYLPNYSGGVYEYDTGSEAGSSAERQVYVNNGFKTLGTQSSTLAVKTNVSELTADGVSDGHPDDTRTLLERARSLNSIRFEYTARANQGLRYNLGFGAEHVEDLFPEATRAYQEEDGSVSGYDDRSMIAILWALWRDADERLQALEG